jgi:hypothetical protein
MQPTLVSMPLRFQAWNPVEYDIMLPCLQVLKKVTLSGGHVYAGQVSNGLLNGLGVHTYSGNKGRYEGQVRFVGGHWLQPPNKSGEMPAKAWTTGDE